MNFLTLFYFSGRNGISLCNNGKLEFAQHFNDCNNTEFRSSCLEFLKNRNPQTFCRIHRKKACAVVSFQSRCRYSGCHFIKKRHKKWHRKFTVNFAKFLRTLSRTPSHNCFCKLKLSAHLIHLSTVEHFFDVLLSLKIKINLAGVPANLTKVAFSQ